MSYNGTGTFLINTAGQPVVTNTVISATTFNLLTADLANGLTNVITKDGQTTVTANIPMSNFKITGLGAATTANDAVRLEQLTSGATNVSFGNLSYTGTLTGGTGVINIGSGQLVKDASGNVGIGVTPSAWSSGKALEVGALGTSVWTANAGDMYVTSNAYFNSGFKYGNTGSFATAYEQTAGQHRWFTAPSGTAGNAISFTQAMTLDASGKLLVGTTSSTGSNRLVVAGSLGASTDNSGCSIRLLNIDGPNYASINAGVVGNTNSGMQFSTDGVSRMVIDGSGNLLVGTTSVTGKITSFITGAAGYSISAGTDNAGAALYSGAANATIVYTVFGNGNVVNTNNSYGAISDLKLKENIIPVSPKLDKLMQVEIVNYNLKDQPEHKLLGVVAQQLEQVFPSLVEKSPDRDADGKDLGTITKSVKYSVFVPMLIKAIQEQQALIQDLTTRLTALEGN
jgi:hypothetical protein